MPLQNVPKSPRRVDSLRFPIATSHQYPTLTAITTSVNENTQLVPHLSDKYTKSSTESKVETIDENDDIDIQTIEKPIWNEIKLFIDKMINNGEFDKCRREQSKYATWNNYMDILFVPENHLSQGRDEI